MSVVPQQTFRERLSTAFEDLCTYARQGLYHTIVAQEFLEYQCRKLQHAYYLDLPEGHSKRVTPERFHAESWMRQEADLLSGLLEGYQWGAIIIDDYFQQPLRTSSRDDSSASPVRTVNKSELIESLLRWKSGSQLRLLNRNDSPPMRGYVSFAADQIRQYNHADVILLDYYFNDADSQNPQEQYANKLIRKLISSRNRFERLNWKPHDKFWIFPISVFDRALQSHLKVYGEGQVSEHIELSEGADPVNTPELFRCLLLRFLHAQRMQVGVSLEELFKYLAPANRDEEPHKFRFHLRRNYFRIIEKVAPYFAYNLSPRKKNSAPRNQISHADKSLLIRSVLDKTKHQREFVALLMRLQHLIYLVAFGPAWEWRKIQQELLHVETLLQLLLPAEQAAASAGKDWSIFVGMVRAYYQAMKKD
ncbi:MAG: hypothetical protein NW241_05875 [Bacteroidia bacterium]|nr:hypothetical protein [Bacteroidia bacterium]